MLNGKIEGGGTGSSSSLFGFTSEEIATSVWLLDYKTHGETSHVYKRSKVWAALMNSGAAINDNSTSGIAADYVVNNNGHLGKLLGNIEGIDDSIDWLSYPTIDEIGTNQEILSYIISNNDLYNLFMTSSKLQQKFLQYCDSYPSIIDQLITKFQSKQTTTTGIYTGPCVVLSGISNISKKSGFINENEASRTCYTFAKGGLKYVNPSNNTIVVTAGGTSTGTQWNNNHSSGTLVQPYAQSSHTIRHIAFSLQVITNTSTHPENAGYSWIQAYCSAGGSFTYVPIM